MVASLSWLATVLCGSDPDSNHRAVASWKADGQIDRQRETNCRMSLTALPVLSQLYVCAMIGHYAGLRWRWLLTRAESPRFCFESRNRCKVSHPVSFWLLHCLQD
jgi:hypothetical protein